MKTVYRKLAAEMMLAGMYKIQAAEHLGISYSCFLQKMKGRTDFLLSEAIALKELLKFEGSLEELFQKYV